MPDIEKEKLAVDIVGDYLKEEKNIHIKNAKHLTQKGGDPPDYYFEIGDHNIGCEIRNFDIVDQPAWKKGKNLARESGIIDDIEKRIKQSLHEKGIPPLDCSPHFIKPPTEYTKHAEKIADLITMMHNESITDSQEYEQNDPEKFYRLFIKNNISSIDILYYPDRANIDEKYTFRHSGAGFLKIIEVEEMQAVIDEKNKDIPCYKANCDQKWLIIVNDGTIDYFTLADAAKEAQYTCNFDKVLYIQLGSRKQKPTGSRTDTFTVYELKAESRAKLNQ